MKITLNLKAFINKLLLCLIGLTIVSSFIWMRFVRERLPKDIPFDLSLSGFLLLLYICCIYLYIIINLFSENKAHSVLLSTIVSYIYKPLKTLDQTIKTNTIIQPYYEKLLIYLVNLIKNNVNLTEGHSYLRLYILVQIIPRIILVSALLIDTFYLHCLSILYKIIIVGLILIISRYIEYSFTYAQEQYIQRLEYITDGVWTNYHDPDDFEYDFSSLVLIRKFIDLQVLRLGDGLEGYSYSSILSDKYITEYKNYNNILPNQIFSNEQYDDIKKEFHKIMEIVIPLSVHIKEYYYSKDYSRCNYAKIIIFSMYLLCWGYILIISFHTLPVDTFIFISEIIDIEDPFSQLNMENNLVNEQQKEITLLILTKPDDNNDKD